MKTQTPLTKTEAIEALQAVLALNGISLVNIGDKFVKVLPSDQAGTAAGDFDHGSSTNLPDLGTYVTHIVQLKYVKPTRNGADHHAVRQIEGHHSALTATAFSSSATTRKTSSACWK